MTNPISRTLMALCLFTSLTGCLANAIKVGNPADDSNTAHSSDDIPPTNTPEEIPSTALLDGVGIPGETGDGQRVESPVIRQQAALLYEPLSTPLDEVVCFEEPIVEREMVGPYSEPVSAGDFTGTVFFVDDDASGDGTRASPFGTIGAAVAAASALETTSAILVAGGTYEEDLTVGPGQYIYGGFDAATWERNLKYSPSTLRNQTSALSVRPSHADNHTLIDGFTIYGAVSNSVSSAVDLRPGSRLILRHNTIFMSLSDVDWETYGDTHYGRGIYGSEASLQAYNNRFLVPSESPEHMISTGLLLFDSCEVLFNNHFVGYRASIGTYATEGAVVGNLIEDGYNGIMTHGESITIKENTIALQAYDNGCGYSIYMEDYGDAATHPEIDNNVIIVQGGSGNGINEASTDADPASLVGNHFILLGEVAPNMDSEMLYGDVDQPHSSTRFNKPLYTIGEVNGMTDIAEIGGNTISSYSEGDLGL